MTPATARIDAQHKPAPARAIALDVGALGRALVASGDVRAADWSAAEEVARRTGQTALRALLDLGLLGEDALADAVSAHTGWARWRAAEETGGLSDALPRAFLEAHSMLALAPREGEAGPVRLVVADPADQHALRAAVGQVGALGAPARLCVGAQKDIRAFLDALSVRPEAAGETEGGAGAIDVAGEISHLRDLASEAPVIRLFNQTIERALDVGASDVHIDRYDHRPSLRFRVDGLLIDQPAPPASLLEPLLCRVKILAGLDIAERRLPQDGRVRMRLRGRSVDLRVSLIPTMYGQDAAIRIQDRARLGRIALEDLGFGADERRFLEDAARKSHGIVLITGPTGSGKTTTLYALLRTLAGAERKIITVEDPVEYAMEGVNQIQVNPAIGLTFSNTLRHILRHDPDVALIGEIRDRETAQMAFQAALTGHMVLSTLHTNDVPGTFVRLLDMGEEPYLESAAVQAVTAQRLLRRLCRECGNDAARRAACAGCRGLGYRGRIAIMERSGLTPALQRAVATTGGDERALRGALAGAGYRTLRDRAAELVAQGITDEAEVARALGLPSAVDEAGEGGA